MGDDSKRYWNERTQRWECGNEESENHGKPAKDQSGKPNLIEKVASRLAFGGPDEEKDD